MTDFGNLLVRDQSNVFLLFTQIDPEFFFQVEGFAAVKFQIALRTFAIFFELKGVSSGEREACTKEEPHVFLHHHQTASLFSSGSGSFFNFTFSFSNPDLVGSLKYYIIFCDGA
jgi:hypothetical protein